MIKLTIIKDLKQPDWLEATWFGEENAIWCESYSGHREHIDMLVNKAIEFGTDLTDEDKELIREVSEAYVYPTKEEIETEVVSIKVAEYKAYLASTDYKMTVDYFNTLTEVEQQDLIAKRAEAREYIRSH